MSERKLKDIEIGLEEIGFSLDRVANAIRKGTQGDDLGPGAVEAIAIALSGDNFAEPVGAAITHHAEQISRVADALESIAKAISEKE